MSSIKLLACGQVGVEDILYLDKKFVIGGDHKVVRRERRGCGHAYRALKAAAQLEDVEIDGVAYGGIVGNDDPLSDFIVNDMQYEGVDLSYSVIRRKCTLNRSTVVVDAEGAQILCTEEGTEGGGQAGNDGPGECVIRSAGVVLVDDSGISGQIRVAKIARKAGIPVVGHHEWMCKEKSEELLALIDHLIIPIRSAQLITGRNPRMVEEIVKDSWEMDHVLVAVTDGEEGLWWTDDGKHIYHLPAFKVEVTKPFSGCGDVFRGVYAFDLASSLSTKTVSERLQFAAAAAAIYARDGAPPTREKLIAFLCEEANMPF